MKGELIDLKNCTTAEQALENPDLCWAAEPVGLVTESGLSVPDHHAIVRSDTKKVIGIVGNRYTPLQNSFAFSWFDTVLQQNNGRYSKAYVIDGGRKVILEATLNGGVAIRKGDEIFRKVSLINTFDGSYPFTAIFTVWRQVCSNGLWGWAKDNKCKVHHTKNGEVRAEEALRIIAKGMTYFNRFEDQCRTLAQKIMDRKMIDSFLDSCFGKEGGTRQKNLRKKVEECYEAGKGTGQGTAWDMYNAYNEWIDHYRSADPETRLANSVLGAAHLKEQAFNHIVSLAK
jgi:phage/plasmid-like protein (TIGR03299 family)